jgi:hypothetical protein
MVHDCRNKSVILSFNNPKHPLIMPIRYLFVSCFLLLMGHSVQAARGIFQTYAIVNVNNTGNQYRAGGANADNATAFSGNNFGTAATSIFLNGGEIKTFKNGSSDVTGAKLYYRVYPASASPTGAFVEVNLPFGQDLGGGNQKWTATTAAINIAAGLTPGTYQLEVYWKITSNEGDVFDSNGGNNYKATFTITSSTLPVTLARFAATPGPQRTAQLDWTTASERNNARFEIERGPDALHWSGRGQRHHRRSPQLFIHRPISQHRPQLLPAPAGRSGRYGQRFAHTDGTDPHQRRFAGAGQSGSKPTDNQWPGRQQYGPCG